MTKTDQPTNPHPGRGCDWTCDFTDGAHDFGCVWPDPEPAEAPVTPIVYTVPSDRPTITVGEIRKLIEGLPDDRPVTILKPDGGDWLNIEGFQNNDDPDGDSEPSAMFTTRDDFDTRQW